MARTPNANNLPIPAQRALRKLGQDIKAARLRRRIPVAVLADRASMSQNTLFSIEKGAPTVSMGNYASVLYSLGLVDRIAGLADAGSDLVGMALEEERLPKRVRPAGGSTRKRAGDE